MRFYLLFIVMIFISCSATRMTETILYFGQSKPDGSMISESDWSQFRKNYLSRVYKEGYSVMAIQGYWRDPVTFKMVTEPTYQVIYYHKPSSIISERIDSLRYWYRQLFQQQSVLRVDRKVKTSF